MRSARVVFVLIGSLMLALYFYGDSIGEVKPIRVVGCHSMSGQVDAWAKSFRESGHKIPIVVAGCDIAKGFGSLFKRDAEIVMASRNVLDEEKTAASRSGIDLGERQVAIDGLVLVVSDALPIHELSLEQARKVFTGEITTWSSLGGPNIPIEPITFDPRLHGNIAWFRENVLGKAPFSPRLVRAKNPRDLFLNVARRKGGIGLVGHNVFMRMPKFAKEFTAVAVKIKKDEGSPAITATEETIGSGAYPLRTPLYLFWDRKTQNREIEEFVDYCAKSGSGKP